MKIFDVVTIGSAVKDIMFFTDAGKINKVRDNHTWTFLFDQKVKSDKVHMGFGGGAANTAVNFNGLGLRTGTVLALGDDEDGEMFKRFLRKKGISTSSVQVHKNTHTGFTVLLIHEKNRDHIAFTHYGATEQLAIKKKELSTIQTDWWYVSSINNRDWEKSMKAIVEQPGKFAWNPGGTQLQAGYRKMKPILEKTCALFLNKQESVQLVASHPKHKGATLKKFTGMRGGNQLAELISEMGPEIVVITDGKKGIFAKHGQDVYNNKPPKDDPVDTTGAGDAFGSTFVAGFHKTSDIEKAINAAILNTTSVVHQRGAQAGFLSWSKLKPLL